MGSCPPDSGTPETARADTHERQSGGDRKGSVSHSGSKRPAQHAEYHNAETKRRRESAERAAQAQRYATQLVQQLAAPEGHSLPQESSGTLAKAEDRQNAYNLSIDSKPWASGHDSMLYNIDPIAGLPMQSGHYSHAKTAGGQRNSPPNAATDGSPVEQTNSDPAIRAAALQSDSSEGDKDAGDKDSKAGSTLPPAPECAKFSSTQKFKRNVHSNPGYAAIKDRQMDEQTHQNHPQNFSASGNRYAQTSESCQSNCSRPAHTYSYRERDLHVSIFDTFLLRHKSEVHYWKDQGCSQCVVLMAS